MAKIRFVFELSKFLVNKPISCDYLLLNKYHSLSYESISCTPHRALDCFILLGHKKKL